ncbi:hypothetical protein CONPUDRAFT_69642 [Coniophora puteana RWD-64-598 SS2]|uniref:Small nuclear ribonucleoprotein Prp3 C-terminal domain-containing protein n=1 Tax=Coniophora puteana (strain RWD-64-598) TaxID=741705 RepID=A0A5M3N7K9_CONPW|nr:uncharacterized protein CONPUDRAFT_69642 [Coniophora puteana RWD-64-598 SS2]EIW87429.1 hypothetical protein CONPUDRAFT_69642 [Coniophora puteana RWD-64-598 SS2]
MSFPNLSKQLEELNLIRFSLLPDELLVFVEDEEKWMTLLDGYADDDESRQDTPARPARFQVKSLSARMWFEITLAPGHPHDKSETEKSLHGVTVHGENMSQEKQQRWQGIISEVRVESEILESETPIYQLLSILLPLVHEEAEEEPRTAPDPRPSKPKRALDSPTYHVLFTSHHLISPAKRRSLQSWTSELSLLGFAKVGYPGVIYAEGAQGDIEEFTSRVKAMQWLALKVRFVEPLDPKKRRIRDIHGATEGGSWCEYQKVGKVVEAMRRFGREEYVVEMGIGSAGSDKHWVGEQADCSALARALRTLAPTRTSVKYHVKSRWVIDLRIAAFAAGIAAVETESAHRVHGDGQRSALIGTEARGYDATWIQVERLFDPRPW